MLTIDLTKAILNQANTYFRKIHLLYECKKMWHNKQTNNLANVHLFKNIYIITCLKRSPQIKDFSSVYNTFAKRASL